MKQRFFYIVFIFLLIIGLVGFFVLQNKKNTFKKADETGVTEEAIKKTVSANNKFALNLYSYLSSENPNQNIFFSPYGIWTAMAMAYEGANGDTANEIKSLFYFSKNSNIRWPAIGSIYNQLNKPKKDYQLLTANALWIQNHLQSNVFKTIQRYYGAEVFINTSAKKINRWIKQKTMNKFKDVVKDCKPTSELLCGLSLINTIYFKGDWEKEFKKSKTKEVLFTVSEKDKIKVPMMNQIERFNYMETTTMQMLEMLYKGHELSMLILLPKNFSGNLRGDRIKSNSPITNSQILTNLTSLEKALTEQNIKTWRKNLYQQRTKVYIPKFTFKKEYKLSKTLKPYMPLAFSKKKADFKKFAENIKKPKNLFIKDIIHKAFINVNEKGTEATAVTSIRTMLIASMPPVFKADQPFLFLIQDRKTGQILFIGKVVNPKA